MNWDAPYTAPAPEAPVVPVVPVVEKAHLVGALRELEAAKARVERDAKQVVADMKKQVVGELLPVLDNLDRTIAAASDPVAIDGIRMVRSQLEAVLRGYGVERIDALDRPFDPTIHEAITLVPVASPHAHNRVVDQIAAGYKFGATLLRPAKVVVGAWRAPFLG